MKKLLYMLTAATILLQACSTGKSFSKKRYGHMKWINHNAHVEVPGKDVTPAQPVNINRPADETAVITEEKNAQTIVVDQPQKAVNTPQNTQTVTQPLSPAANTDSKPQVKEDALQPEQTVNEEAVAFQQKLEQEKVKPAAAKPMMDDTAKLIICVILAIIIPPLGMYLWDQQTDIWFILALVFFLLWVFTFIGYAFGLLALLAVVIALLRIFELL